jgi:hypothetical protein
MCTKKAGPFLPLFNSKKIVRVRIELAKQKAPDRKAIMRRVSEPGATG